MFTHPKQIKVPPLICKGGKTEQHHRDQLDINKLIAKYKRTGALPINLHSNPPIFADFSNTGDYQSIMNKVIAMERFFNRLDPEVRLKFNHNAGNMVDFVNNPDNVRECVKMGILPRSVLPKDIIPDVPPGEPVKNPAEIPPAN